MTSSTSSPLDALPEWQRPRIWCLPEEAHSFAAGWEAVELAELAGLELDPWQKFVLVCSLAERRDGSRAVFEVGVNVARQNGKGGILEPRELAGLYLLPEPMQIHSAHQFDTSLEAFRRLLMLIEQTPELDRRVKRVVRSHGEEGIELKGGKRIRFRTRTKGGGRGFSGNSIYLDEAMYLPEAVIGALMPVVSAKDPKQLWYTGSAVDQLIHPDGLVFARLRARALAGGDPSLFYAEWSAPFENPDDVPPEAARDERVWQQGNPALRIRIEPEHVANEQRSMDPRTFAVERLGVGDWPALDGDGGVISLDDWLGLTDPGSRMLDPVCIAFDVDPDRRWASICAAGLREDGRPHVEVIERKPGTGWVVERLVGLVKRWNPEAKTGAAGVICDDAGPAGTLIPELEKLEIEVVALNGRDYARACGLIFDVVEQKRLRHLGTQELAAAVRGAVARPLGEKWAWGRRNSGVDITSLVACTLALWGVLAEDLEETEPMVAWA